MNVLKQEEPQKDKSKSILRESASNIYILI